MKVEYHPSTTKDLNQAIEYYDSQRSGLGAECRAEVYAAIGKIVDAPQHYTGGSGQYSTVFRGSFSFRSALRGSSRTIVGYGFS